jgi:hypothetical protein
MSFGQYPSFFHSLLSAPNPVGIKGDFWTNYVLKWDWPETAFREASRAVKSTANGQNQNMENLSGT